MSESCKASRQTIEQRGAQNGKIHKHKAKPKWLGKQEDMADVVKKQLELMQNKQWTIQWQDKPSSRSTIK